MNIKPPKSGTGKSLKELWSWLCTQIKEFAKRLRSTLSLAMSDFYVRPWFYKKSLQTVARTTLLHYLAIAMTCVVLVREWPELSAMISELRPPKGLAWLIFPGIVGTIYTAIVELSGRRRTTSKQELRFHSALKELLEELQILSEFQGTAEKIGEQFNLFSQRLVDIASETFSARYPVHAGLMLEEDDPSELKLKRWSKGAQYDSNLVIQVPRQGNFRSGVPAGISFAKKSVVYVPSKDAENLKNAWSFRFMADRTRKTKFIYQAEDPVLCWQKVAPELEKFRTVICVSIPDHGVLNFSSTQKDDFIDRDFFMAECFAKILGHAVTLTRMKRPT